MKYQMKSLRNAYGDTLVKLGGENENIVVLEADLSKSTMGCLFKKAFPNRFFEMGIAEANMASTAAGLSLTGKIPFASTFAAFATGRCYDQIKTSICIPKLNVKICGSSAGLSDYGDGSTHQTIDDIAIMNVLPNIQVYSPVDAVQTVKIMEYMAENQGPMYIRINRSDLPVLTSAEEEFVPGKVYTIREGRDIAIFGTGVMVSRAMEAAEKLSAEDISVKVVNVPSIKPIDKAAIRSIVSSAKGVVTAEEHSIIGGLGSIVASVLASDARTRVEMVGINDSFGTSAESYDILLRNYQLTEDSIIKAVKKLLN